jgi:hypothetical protein
MYLFDRSVYSIVMGLHDRVGQSMGDPKSYSVSSIKLVRTSGPFDVFLLKQQC